MENIPYWNVHSHHVRTNNDIEGWHFSMKRSLKRPHPDIFTFIDWMRNEELYSRNIVAKSDPGQDVKRYNAVYDKINNDLTLLQDEYVHKLRSRSSMLRGCALHLSSLPTRSKISIKSTNILDPITLPDLTQLDIGFVLNASSETVKNTFSTDINLIPQESITLFNGDYFEEPMDFDDFDELSATGDLIAGALNHLNESQSSI